MNVTKYLATIALALSALIALPALTALPAHAGSCSAPSVWNNAVGACIAPMHTKVGNVGQLPQGCTSWKQQCWKDAVASGLVKFVATSAKMTGYNDRPVVKAFFRNRTTMFGVTGLWNVLEFYADDVTPVGPDIFGGVSSEIDWVYGTKKGVVVHEKPTGLCYESHWNSTGGFWETVSIGRYSVQCLLGSLLL